VCLLQCACCSVLVAMCLLRHACCSVLNKFQFCTTTERLKRTSTETCVWSGVIQYILYILTVQEFVISVPKENRSNFIAKGNIPHIS
jgi:hypothetical protein